MDIMEFLFNTGISPQQISEKKLQEIPEWKN